MANTTTMMPLTTIRPSSMAGHHRNFARPPHIEADAGENQRDQNQRDRTPEEAWAPDTDRLQQRIFRDLSENYANDKGRPRPIMALEKVTEAAHHQNQNQVLPIALKQVTAQ